MKRSHNDVFYFFFGIPYFGSGWNRSEREFFFSLILNQSCLSLAWKVTTKTFFNFFTIFLEFPLPGPVGMVQNENFLFVSFSASPVPFWHVKKPYWCFLIFLIFLQFFLNSLIWVRFEWIGTIIFFSSHSQLVPSRFGFKGSHIDVFFFFNFFNFFAIFLEIPIPGRDWMDRNDNFLFFSQSQPVRSHSWLK